MAFLMFIFVFIIVFSILYWVKNIKVLSKIDKNLQYIAEKKIVATPEEYLTKDPLMKRFEKFIKTKFKKSENGEVSLKKKKILDNLVKVYGKSMTYDDWMAKRIVTTIIVGVSGLVGYLLVPQTLVLVFALIFPVAVYFLFESDIKNKSKEIDWNNFIFFPYILSSIAMLYQIGYTSNIFIAFSKVSENYKHHLIDELKYAVEENDSNKDKYDVLRDLAKRVNFKEFNTFITMVIQCEKTGMPLEKIISEYAESMSAKRKIMAMAELEKIPRNLETTMLLITLPIAFIYMVAPSLLMALQGMKGV